MEPEEIIVNRLINKDKDAFEFIFNQYFSVMVNYAFKFMDTRVEAEEVVQDVFFKFWERCESLSTDTSIKSYLYRSVHNSCLNVIKHNKVKDSYRQHVVQYMESSYQQEWDKEDQESVATQIREEIDALPPRCSQIFKLSRYEGLKYQEIADHLEISVKTVEVQMGKALKTLREKLRHLRGGQG